MNGFSFSLLTYPPPQKKEKNNIVVSGVHMQKGLISYLNVF